MIVERYGRFKNCRSNWKKEERKLYKNRTGKMSRELNSRYNGKENVKKRDV